MVDRRHRQKDRQTDRQTDELIPVGLEETRINVFRGERGHLPPNFGQNYFQPTVKGGEGV